MFDQKGKPGGIGVIGVTRIQLLEPGFYTSQLHSKEIKYHGIMRRNVWGFGKTGELRKPYDKTASKITDPTD